ncbi:MAG: hypothetical protein MZV65_38665 [Chromatiales bacterium]|nr:hypothetical protein [Chromatiales bacterium]
MGCKEPYKEMNDAAASMPSSQMEPINLLSPNIDERKPSAVPLSPMEPTNLLSHLDERKPSAVDQTDISSRKEVAKAMASMSEIAVPHDVATTHKEDKGSESKSKKRTGTSVAGQKRRKLVTLPLGAPNTPKKGKLGKNDIPDFDDDYKGTHDTSPNATNADWNKKLQGWLFVPTGECPSYC